MKCLNKELPHLIFTAPLSAGENSSKFMLLPVFSVAVVVAVPIAIVAAPVIAVGQMALQGVEKLSDEVGELSTFSAEKN